MVKVNICGCQLGIYALRVDKADGFDDEYDVCEVEMG
jgi:hypothetical protein